MCDVGKYEPKSKALRVVEDGVFYFAAIGLNHGHVNGMTEGLITAGATLKWVYDTDEGRVERFVEKFPGVKVASSEEEIFADEEVQLVASACITSERADLGIRVMKAGKHYFTDKAPMTTLDQLERVTKTCAETGKKFAVWYSERIASESAVHAGTLIKEGAIGKVVQVLGLGPHRLNAGGRPDWFFKKEQYGGILCDIGSHQIEQFLYYTGATDATIVNSKVANCNNPEYDELEDYGEATLLGDNGASGFFRVDWLTPKGLSTWGDGRTVILGTEGYIELRKYIDIAHSKAGDHLYLVNGDGEFNMCLEGKVGLPYFGELILDCINETEFAMTQEHTFKAAELCLIAQERADAE
ncbi:MAG: Gfo/Idh/MocA family oxidoreductase [Lachnospiraceae bacterium]